MKRELLLACAAASFFLGCSTTATIHRRNGRDIETTLVGHDDEHIYFKTKSGAHRLKKDDVTDIDHPGDLDILFGLLLSTYGAINIAAGQKNCDYEGTAYCIGVYTPLTVGVMLTGFGLITYSESTDALDTKVKVGPWEGLNEGSGNASAPR